MNKTCADCIHDGVCDMGAVEIGMPFTNATTCGHYIAKVDESLKPCPFCGGRVGLLDYTDRVYGFWDYKIKCPKCRVYMDSPSTAIVAPIDNGIRQIRNEETKLKARRELILIWNERASEQAPKGGDTNA